MGRKYGSDKREEEKRLLGLLIAKIESIYLESFESLNDAELGSGSITKLAQVFLLSRDSALTILKNEKSNIK